FAKRLFLLAEVEVHGRLTVIISPRTAGPQPRDVLWLALPRHNLASDCRPQPRDVLRLALPHHTSAIDHERLTRDIPGLVRGEEHRCRADVLRLLLALHRHDVGDALLEHLPRRHALERRVGLRDMDGELLPEVGPQD